MRSASRFDHTVDDNRDDDKDNDDDKQVAAAAEEGAANRRRAKNRWNSGANARNLAKFSRDSDIKTHFSAARASVVRSVLVSASVGSVERRRRGGCGCPGLKGE